MMKHPGRRKLSRLPAMVNYDIVRVGKYNPLVNRPGKQAYIGRETVSPGNIYHLEKMCGTIKSVCWRTL
ncbi:MAG: hypothetical protein GY940_16580 [bacterium]|nr:hypothetical protein [bacterium]